MLIPCHVSCVQCHRQTKDQTKEYVERVAQELTPVALTTRELERASEHDHELKSARECLLNGKWHAFALEL